MRIGVIGGTGPAGGAVGVRLAAAGHDVLLGSRSPERAVAAVDELKARWAGHDLVLRGAANTEAAEAELVVLATPWDGVLTTVKELEKPLAAKTVVTMVNAMTRLGSRMGPLVLPTGSVAVALAQALPASTVVGAFHHVPAGPLGDPHAVVEADVMVFGEKRAAKDLVTELVGQVPGLRGVDVGGLVSALAVEALTAVLVEVNRKYKTHASVKVTGLV